MALLAIESREVEVVGRRQSVELDPVLEWFARQPYRTCAHHDEAVAKSAPQRAQPGTPRVVRKDHQDGGGSEFVTGALRREPRTGAALIDDWRVG